MTDEMNIAENGVEEQNLYEDALRSAEKEIEKDNVFESINRSRIPRKDPFLVSRRGQETGNNKLPNP